MGIMHLALLGYLIFIMSLRAARRFTILRNQFLAGFKPPPLSVITFTVVVFDAVTCSAIICKPPPSPSVVR